MAPAAARNFGRVPDSARGRQRCAGGCRSARGQLRYRWLGDLDVASRANEAASCTSMRLSLPLTPNGSAVVEVRSAKWGRRTRLCGSDKSFVAGDHPCAAVGRWVRLICRSCCAGREGAVCPGQESRKSIQGMVSPGSRYRSVSTKPCLSANRSPSSLEDRTTVSITSAPSCRARLSPRA